MELLPVAYCCIVPVLLLLMFSPLKDYLKKQCANALATINLLMLFHAIFLVRQLIGLLLLAKTLSNTFHMSKRSVPDIFDGFALRNIVIILLPLLFLRRQWRISLLPTICLLVFIYWNHSFAFWNTYHLAFKIPAYCCLFCAGYALLWLFNQLPYQSPKQ